MGNRLSMESDALLILAEDYLHQERNKDFTVENRIRLTYLAGITKGHTICANGVTESILDNRRAEQ